jgi:hypothetical protein
LKHGRHPNHFSKHKGTGSGRASIASYIMPYKIGDNYAGIFYRPEIKNLIESEINKLCEVEKITIKI